MLIANIRIINWILERSKLIIITIIIIILIILFLVDDSIPIINVIILNRKQINKGRNHREIKDLGLGEIKIGKFIIQ